MAHTPCPTTDCSEPEVRDDLMRSYQSYEQPYHDGCHGNARDQHKQVPEVRTVLGVNVVVPQRDDVENVLRIRAGSLFATKSE